jgi:hypothetical protein
MTYTILVLLGGSPSSLILSSLERLLFQREVVPRNHFRFPKRLYVSPFWSKDLVAKGGSKPIKSWKMLLRVQD